MPRKWRLNLGKRAKALGWVSFFKLWNSLPDKLKDCPNVKTFLRAYTSHFAAMNADLDDFTIN